MLLRTENISKQFNGIYALKGIDMDIQEGEIHGLVAMTAANTYLDAGIPLLSASASHPDYSGMGEYIFRNNVLISQEVETVLQICQNSGSKRVGVLVLKNDWDRAHYRQWRPLMNR